MKLSSGVYGVFFLLSILIAGSLLQKIEELMKPFRIKEFLLFIEKGQYYRDPPSSLYKYNLDVVFNQNYFHHSDDIRRRALIVDAKAILDSMWTPFSYKDYVSRNIYQAGVAFPCFQFMIIDGSIIDRTAANFLTRMGGLPSYFENQIKSPNMTSEIAFEFVFLHEYQHLALFHFSLPSKSEIRRREKIEEASRSFRGGNFKDAIFAYEGAIRMCPSDYKVIDHLAIAHRYVGNLSKSGELYVHSMKINPMNEVAARNVLLVYMLQRLPDPIIEQVKINRKRLSKSIEDDYFAGMAYFLKNDLTTAFDYLGLAQHEYIKDKGIKALEVTLIRIKILKMAPEIGDIVAESNIAHSLCEIPQNKSFFATSCDPSREAN